MEVRRLLLLLFVPLSLLSLIGELPRYYRLPRCLCQPPILQGQTGLHLDERRMRPVINRWRSCELQRLRREIRH